MKSLYRLLLVLASASFFYAPAQAQNSGTVTNHAVPVGKGPGVTGFSSAAPSTAGIPLTSNGATSDPSFGSVAAAGIQSNAVTNAKVQPGAANTFKGSLNGSTTSDIALTACTLSYQITKWVSGTGWQCGLNPVLPSRAIAATLDLSAFSAVTTQGYALPGDGGGSTFKSSGSATFLDTYISTVSAITAGSGYTNGSYLGVPLTGGSGSSCLAAVTVAGGVVTAVTRSMPCVGYTVGDVLTTPNANIGGTGSGFSITVTAISTPQGSFTDFAGTHWQYVENSGRVNALQFGCKGDWGGIGSDASSTNNSPCLWSAIAYVSRNTAWVGGYGGHLYIPRGAYMTCGQFLASGFYIPVPQSVRISGASIFGTTLAECAADAGSIHYVGLCDAVAKVGQFGCKLENITLYLWQVTTASAGIAAIYSNSGQQFVLGENVEVDAYARGCVKYETGSGGAANDIWIGIDCVQHSSATNAGFLFNSSGTQHILERSVCASGPAGAAVCIAHANGRLIASGLDIEGYVIGLQQNVSTGGNVSSYKNVQEQGASCSEAIQLSGTNTPGNILIENIATGCPITILNGQAGGTNFTGNVVKQITCVSGACS